mgnify:CR=1 FL=1
MGVSLAPSGKGGKKALDAELNLIPFIDLLIVNICFLLITAVWVQMARIKVSQKGKGTAAEKTDDVPPEMRVKVVVLVGDERLVVTKQGQVYDLDKLGKQLREIKARLPNKEDLTVAAEDGIAYKHLIAAMDVALAEHFTQIQVSDAGAAL